MQVSELATNSMLIIHIVVIIFTLITPEEMRKNNHSPIHIYYVKYTICLNIKSNYTDSVAAL